MTKDESFIGMYSNRSGICQLVSLVMLLLCACSPKSAETDQDGASQSTTVSTLDVNSPVMLTGSWIPNNDPHQIDFDNLPRVPSVHSVVSDVRGAGGKRVNQHNYLVYYKDRFWAMWSDGPGVPRTDPDKHGNVTPGHDQAGQHVSYATSPDGIVWSESKHITIEPDKGFGWISRGFWVREGKLLALASRFQPPGYANEGLQLHAFEAEVGETIKWKHLGMAYDNTLNNFPPKQLPSGEWMMSRRDSLGNVHFMVGGVKAFNDWQSFPVVSRETEEVAASEPNWWLLPDNTVMALFRDNKRSNYLFRAYSMDQGRTWTKLHKTNFPDALSKFSGTRLKDGRYVLVSSPDPKKREPIAISVSDDGTVFYKMGYLVGGRKVDYPHVIEHDGYVYVAFSSAKQTIEVLKIKLSDLDALKMD